MKEIITIAKSVRTKNAAKCILSGAIWALIVISIVSLNEVSSSSADMSSPVVAQQYASLTALNGDIQKLVPLKEIAVQRFLDEKGQENILARPRYLTRIDNHLQQHIETESSVFHILKERESQNREFIKWFNALKEEEKRGFILFIRSIALSSYLGSEIRFTEEHWMSGRLEKIKELTREFLETIDTMSMAKKYAALYTYADSQRLLFLSNNTWLGSYLNENYPDFEKGLFYFFLEHIFSNSEIEEKSHHFSSLKEKMMVVSEAIIADREKNTRISPKQSVRDGQIKEIVTASFFTELFYGIPADFMTLISAYETNFSMVFWDGGCGTTQQTTKAANTVLQSDFWIGRVYESAGIKVRLQMVPISALDSVFLCISEAAKTIAIKAAELRIKTDEISPLKRVKFADQLLPATWVTAYRYNGSKKNAKQYATGVHRYYKERKWWLKSFSL